MEKKLLRETTEITDFLKKVAEVKEDIETYGTPLVYEKLPVWRLDEENLNGRIYSTELATKLVADNAITNALRNHIDTFEAEILDIKGIAKNPVIEDGFLKVDIHMVDENFASLIEKITKAGGKVGLSSVGYGFVDEDKIVRDYTLERYADFVINPSALVFIEDSSKEETETDSEIEASIEEEDTAVLDVEVSNEEMDDIRNRFEVKRNGKH